MLIKVSYEISMSRRDVSTVKEKKMKSRFFILGMAVLILSVSFVFVSCGGSGGGGGLLPPPPHQPVVLPGTPNSALAGTWSPEVPEEFFDRAIIDPTGIFTTSDGDVPTFRGRVYTDGSNIYMVMDDFSGSLLNYMFDISNFSSGWYPINVATLTRALQAATEGMGLSPADISYYASEMVAVFTEIDTGTFTLDGNILTIDWDDGGPPETWIRQ